MGEEVCAWIKLKENEKLTIEELMESTKGKIAHYKVPRYFKFVSEYPLTVTGKVKKNEMRHQTNESLAHGGSDIIDIKKLKKSK
jgi:fatty-acyl-CoA synthase